MQKRGFAFIPPLARALPAILVLTGCTSLQGYASRPDGPGYISEKRHAYFTDLGPGSIEATYNSARIETDRRRLRDEIVYARMDIIEYDFDALERALNGTGNGVILGGDLAVLAANGIGATTGGEQTKAALNALSGGIVGAQGAISKDLYYQRTLPALLAQMEANREKVKADIFTGLGRPDAEYPLGQAQLDLRRLVRAGSIPASVGEITQQATEDKHMSEQLVELARAATFADTPAARTLKAWVMQNGSVDRDRMAALQAWMNAQPEAFLREIPVGTFIRGEMPDARLDPIRQRALHDPALAITQ
ncbi:MAG TPA: hypothetical protein VF727_11585 [Allosphingosinicella sp.]|jgi:hypothetical protein